MDLGLHSAPCALRAAILPQRGRAGSSSPPSYPRPSRPPGERAEPFSPLPPGHTTTWQNRDRGEAPRRSPSVPAATERPARPPSHPARPPPPQLLHTARPPQCIVGHAPHLGAKLPSPLPSTATAMHCGIHPSLPRPGLLGADAAPDVTPNGPPPSKPQLGDRVLSSLRRRRRGFSEGEPSSPHLRTRELRRQSRVRLPGWSRPRGEKEGTTFLRGRACAGGRSEGAAGDAGAASLASSAGGAASRGEIAARSRTARGAAVAIL